MLPSVIDDVTFENCALPEVTSDPCQSDELLCRRGNCVKKSLQCDFVDDCGDYTDENLAVCGSYDK